jgi:hypothetical protein
LVLLSVSPSFADEGEQSDTAIDVLQEVAPAVLDDVANVQTTTEGTDALSVSSSDLQIDVPVDPSRAIAIRSADGGDSIFELSLPSAGTASSAESDRAGVVAYDNADGSTTVAIAKQGGSLQIATVIAEPTAPDRYTYPLNLGSGASAAVTESGAVAISNSADERVATIAPAWATDAAGREVPTSYELVGSNLIQHVELSDPGIQFPVVADPWLGGALIDHATFTKAGNYTDVHVTVTPWIYFGPPTWAADTDGWAELLTKVTSSQKKLLLSRVGYKDQHHCHAMGRAIVGIGIIAGTDKRPTWDYEGKRGAFPGWDRAVATHCNW